MRMEVKHQGMSFGGLVNAILKEVASRNCGIKDKRKLSIDLALVGFCLRTAYLVDAFTPSDCVSFWQELLQQLRSNSLTSFAFASVVHIFEPCSEQSFIANVSMIPLLLGSTLAPANQQLDQSKYPIFVQISQSQTFQLLDALPLPLFTLLDSLHQAFSPSLSNPEVLHPLTYILPHLPPSLSVPLAAILLDFSVGYVPETDTTSQSATSIPGVLMHFFECILSFHEVGGKDAQARSRSSSNVSGKVGNQKFDHADVKSCIVMKFSCPASEQIIPQPEKIIDHLKDLFTKRLLSTGDPTLLNIEIRQTTNTLDRLVL